MKLCKYKQFLSDFLDRRLTSKQEKMVEEHLPLCATCKQEWKELTLLKQMCANLPEQELPVGLHRQIMQQAQKQNKSADKTAWIQRIALPLAAAILLFLFGKGLQGIPGNIENGMQKHAERKNVIMAKPEADVSIDSSTSEEQSTDMAVSDRGEKSSVDMEESRSQAEPEVPSSEDDVPIEAPEKSENPDQNGNASDESYAGFENTIEASSAEGADDAESGDKVGSAGRTEGAGGSENIAYKIPQYVKVGIVAAVLLAFISFLIRILKLKR